MCFCRPAPIRQCGGRFLATKEGEGIESLFGGHSLFADAYDDFISAEKKIPWCIVAEKAKVVLVLNAEF